MHGYQSSTLFCVYDDPLPFIIVLLFKIIFMSTKAVQYVCVHGDLLPFMLIILFKIVCMYSKAVHYFVCVMTLYHL